jgi:UDP-N-acetylglucosamine acyltransferase
LPAIHPTAIVDPLADIADDVEVGPYCIIEGPVTLGAATRLVARIHLRGPMTIGRNNKLYPGVCIGFEPQDRKFDGTSAGVAIGDDNILREGVTVHCANGPDEATTIGSGNFLMTNAHVGHNSVVGDGCTLASGALVGGHASIGGQVFLGGNSAVHQFCRVGRLAILSGVVAVAQDLPPFCLAGYHKRVNGLNLIGLRRAGLRDHVAPLQRAFAILYEEGHGNVEAVALIERELGGDPLCRELAEFVRTSTRGITKYKGGGRGGE